MEAKVNLVPHKIYDVTFLERVIVKINFNAEVDDKYEVLKQFFQDNFNLELDSEKFELFKIKFLRISGNNGVISLKFSKSFIQIRLERDFYRSFEESMIPYLNAIYSLMAKINGSIEKISIKKVNLWPVDMSENADYYDVLKKIFNSNLTDNLPEEKPEEFALSIPNKTGEDKHSLVITFGFVRNSVDDQLPTAILDIEGICEYIDKLDSKNIESTFKEINQDIFNVYHWAVTDQVINVMNGN